MHLVSPRIILTWWFLLIAWALPAAAQDNLVPQTPKDMAQVDAYLLTVGRSTQIEALFGHTILRVIDHSSGQDLAFNWGIFEFSGPLFVWNFYRGELTYMLGIYAAPTLIDFYRNVEHRSIIQQRIVLTTKQKTSLIQRLIRNAQPANLYYQYSQLRDNCATRPRDHLDAALGGKIAAAYQDFQAPVTFRHHIKASSSPVWWVDLGLDMISNDVLDRPLSSWQEMFLPRRLQQLLEQLPAFDDSGTPIPGQTLLTDPVWLVNDPEPMPAPNAHAMWSLFCGVPLSLLLLAVWRRPGTRRSARLLGVASLVYGLWSAFWASVLICNWLLSRYIETKHNALLWLFWPVDWLYVLYGIKLIMRSSLPAQYSLLGGVIGKLSMLHLAAGGTAALLWTTSVMHQDILPMLVSYGVFGGLLFVTVSCHGAALGGRSDDA